MNLALPVLPIMWPLLLALGLLSARNHNMLQRGIGLVGALLQCVICVALLVSVQNAGLQSVYLGGWVPPFGITIVADHLSSLLALATGLIALALMGHSIGSIDEAARIRGFYPLAWILIAGVNGAFLTGDMFNLYVWFEVMLISSFALLMLTRTPAGLEGAVKYVAMNLIKTLLMLTSIGLLYGTLGTLNMADLHLAVQDFYAYENPTILTLVGLMLMLAFGIKAGMFPLYFWLPASYHTPSPLVGALFAALLTKVGVYALLRVFTIVLPLDQFALMDWLQIVAMATMLMPLFGALVENHILRILSFCLLSHIGVILAGLAVYSTESISGMVFYMVHHMVVMAALFLVVGLIMQRTQQSDLRKMGGLLNTSPLLAWIFFLLAMALSGMPPLSGFWPKLLLLQAGLTYGQFALVFVMLLTSLFTLMALLRVWHKAFWRQAVPPLAAVMTTRSTMICQWLPILFLAAFSVWAGIAPETLAQMSLHVGRDALDPSIYVDGVTAGGRR